MAATTAHAASSQPSTRHGGSPASPGSVEPRSDCSSTSRAGSTPEAGTRMSRGPAARKSGTSNPRERRVVLGIPSSSRSPWRNSASGWLRAPATFISGPSAYCGLILRARAWRSETTASPSPSAKVSGSPQDGQKRSAAGCRSPHDGHTASSELDDLGAIDPVGPDDGLFGAEPDDDPRRPRPALGEG